MKFIRTDFSSTVLWELLAATCILLAAAFHNGYPMVFSDSGTYISSGFEGKVPMDRPIVYGLFIRHASLAVTLWGPVLVQSFLLAWVLRLLLLPYFPERFTGKYLLLLAGCCMLTALPWYAGQLMPDIFTAIQIVVLAIVLTRKQLPWRLSALLGALFVLCCLVHFSNLFIGVFTVLGVLAALAIWRVLRPQFPFWQRRSLLVGAWCLSAFILLPAINWVFERQFTLGKGGYTFIIGRMVDNGLLKMYLDDQCAAKNYRLCLYKDSLPENSRKFHWDSSSPLYREGGWGAPEAEYRAIVWGTLTSPKYLGLHLWKSVLGVPTQLMQNAIGSGMDYGWYRSPESPPYQAIQRFFPHEFNEYRASRQCGNLWGQELDLKFFNNLNYWVLCATVLALIWFLFFDQSGTIAPFLPLLAVFGAGVLANAFITSSLGVIADRFSPRVIWLLTLWVLVVLIQKIALFQTKRGPEAADPSFAEHPVE